MKTNQDSNLSSDVSMTDNVHDVVDTGTSCNKHNTFQDWGGFLNRSEL